MCPASLIVAALVLFSLAGALCMAQNGAPPRRPRGFMAPPKPKNLKVLKNIAPQQLMATMRVFSASLGVRCDFCHVEGAFDRDDKPTKRMARKMILMVRDINAHQKILDNKASCFMCHHGSSMPETKVAMRPFPGGPRRGGMPPGGPPRRP